jgi:hypothetical protein
MCTAESNVMRLRWRARDGVEIQMVSAVRDQRRRYTILEAQSTKRMEKRYEAIISLADECITGALTDISRELVAQLGFMLSLDG